MWENLKVSQWFATDLGDVACVYIYPDNKSAMFCPIDCDVDIGFGPGIRRVFTPEETVGWEKIFKFGML